MNSRRQQRGVGGSATHCVRIVVPSEKEKGRDEPVQRKEIRGVVDYLRGFGLGLFPGPLEWFGDKALLDGAGGDANVSHLAIHHGFDALQVWKEPALGNCRHVRADAALFLGFATAPDVAAFDRAFSSQFTNSSHKRPKKIAHHIGLPRAFKWNLGKRSPCGYHLCYVPLNQTGPSGEG